MFLREHATTTSYTSSQYTQRLPNGSSTFSTGPILFETMDQESGGPSNDGSSYSPPQKTNGTTFPVEVIHLCGKYRRFLIFFRFLTSQILTTVYYRNRRFLTSPIQQFFNYLNNHQCFPFFCFCTSGESIDFFSFIIAIISLNAICVYLQFPSSILVLLYKQ